MAELKIDAQFWRCLFFYLRGGLLLRANAALCWWKDFLRVFSKHSVQIAPQQ